MTYSEQFPSKNSAAQISYPFEFGDQLLFGEVITGAIVVASLYTGEDPTPNNIVSGPVTVDGTEVSQLIIDGVPGNIYYLLCTCNTSLTHVYTKDAYLAIVDQSTAF